MRYDSEHKDRTRQRVLKEAAAAIRAEGPDRIGVAALMAKAGLTHGGFYAHFKSKDELIAAALDQMFEQARERFIKVTAGAEPAAALRQYIDWYVSERHRDEPANGCPLAALSGDLARMPNIARSRFAAGLESLISAMAKRVRDLGIASPDRVAQSVVSEMVGAVALARALGADDASSARLLQATREALKVRLGLKQA